MSPKMRQREEDDTTNGSEIQLATELSSQRERNPEHSGNHTKNSSNSPDSSTSEIQGQKPRLQASDIRSDFVPLHGHSSLSSWSASSDKQLGSPGAATDRVFPIRSVVSVDPSQTPYTLPGRISGEQQEYFPPGAAGHHIAASHQSRKSSLEANGKPTPPAEQHSHLPGERARGNRKRSNPPARDSDRYGGGLRMQLFSYATSEKSNESQSSSTQDTLNSTSLGTRTPAEQESNPGLVTARFKHVVTAEGHAIITGRDGETLQRCEDEP
jgi:hypothetical protein